MHHPYSIFLPVEEQPEDVEAAIELLSSLADPSRESCEAAYRILREVAGNTDHKDVVEAGSLFLDLRRRPFAEYRMFRQRMATLRKPPNGGGGGGKGEAREQTCADSRHHGARFGAKHDEAR